jgi:hypothetical protein
MRLRGGEFSNGTMRNFQPELTCFSWRGSWGRVPSGFLVLRIHLADEASACPAANQARGVL